LEACLEQLRPVPGRPHPAPPPVPAYLAGTGPAGPAGRRTSSGRWWALAGVAALVALGAGATAALLTADEEPAADDFLALSAEEQLRESEMDMAVVDSARIRGEFRQDDDRISVDVVATTAGDCRGTMTSRASGGSAEVLSVGDNVYLRADAAFWDGVTGEGTAEQVLPLIGDRWVIENSLKESTEAFCDLDEFLERDGREDATVSGLGRGRVDDQESVKVEQSAGPQREVLYIRVAEPHYLLRVEESDVDYFEFSAFDAEVDIQPPPADDVVDIEKLLEEAARGAG
uniref:hypothetical protein n=1 Tax=Nocardioides sp. SYSU DS0651 TaxID=3415955 RepID=UPI003F4C6ED3